MQKAVAGKIAYVQQWKGRKLPAVVEKSRSQRSGVLHAVTGNYLHVECPLDGWKGPVPESGSLVSIIVGKCLVESIASGAELDCLGTFDLP